MKRNKLTVSLSHWCWRFVFIAVFVYKRCIKSILAERRKAAPFLYVSRFHKDLAAGRRNTLSTRSTVEDALTREEGSKRSTHSACDVKTCTGRSLCWQRAIW